MPDSVTGPLPADAILLHIGPYKTGSTALQSALFARRKEMRAHGVSYPGRWRRLFRVGHALLGWAPRGHEVPDVQVWDDFAAGVRKLTDRRVCLSTEDFGRIQNPDKVRKIVEDLGAERLHVVAVARSYHRLLPSHWQERVKSHQTVTYEEFLGQVLDEDKKDRAFHSSHDVAWMTSMWLPHLPADRITVIVTDDSDRELLTRTFEQLLGLPGGLLSLDDNSNASLSHQATEMLRRVNEVFVERGWDDVTYTRYLQRGLVPALQAAGRSAGESGAPPLPTWALEMLRRRSAERVQALADSGVNVIGDPAVLMPPEGLPTTDVLPSAELVPATSAATAIAGVIEAALRRERDLVERAGDAPGREATVAETPAVELVRIVAGRARRRLARGVRL